MDCERYESAMMDELYGELDELTSAAAKRHVAGCARCTALISGFRATRRVAQMPMVDPPADLEERILAAAREAQKVVPLGRRVARAVSLAGGWAMRPQTAMAALFLVMIGTSVLLLRGRSSRQPASADVTVTERGAPAPEPVAAATATATSPLEHGVLTAASAAVATRLQEQKSPASPPADQPAEDMRAARARGAAGKDKDDEGLSAVANASPPGGVNLPPVGGASGGFGPAAAAPAKAQAMEGEKKELSPFDTAQQSYRAGRFDEATRMFDSLAAGDANAELGAARAVRESKGCRNALARFDKVARRAAGTPPGWDALLEGAICYRGVGNFDQARVRLTELLKVDSHKDRAQAELDRLNESQQAQGSTSPPAAAARPAPKHAAAPVATAPNATTAPNADANSRQ